MKIRAFEALGGNLGGFSISSYKMEKAIVAAIVVAFSFLQRQKHEEVVDSVVVVPSPVLLLRRAMHRSARQS